MNDFLRDEVKKLKCFQDINYKEIANYLDIRATSFYNWLKGYYDFGKKRQNQLYEVISNLKEE